MDKIPNMENALRIISLLEKNIFQEISLHQISQRISLDYKTIRKTVQQLVAMSLLKKETKGRGHFVSLNLNHYDLKTYLSFASYANRVHYFQKNHQLIFLLEEIKKLNLGESSLILFGSTVVQANTKSSDIDLLLLTNNQNTAMTLKSLLSNYNLKADLTVVSFDQYKKSLRDRGFNLANQVIEKHIILYRPEVYWNLTLGGLKDGNRY